MNKKLAYAVLSTIVVALILPILTIGYAAVFGHTYNNSQLLAAASLAIGGGITTFIGCMIIDLSK